MTRLAKLGGTVRAGKFSCGDLCRDAPLGYGHMQRDSLATLPNLISLSRLGLAAAFVVLKGTNACLAADIAAAGATDFLDGYLARRRGTTSKWGALIDPIADRFFVFTAVCALLFDGVVTTWQYAILISRDFMTAVGFPHGARDSVAAQREIQIAHRRQDRDDDAARDARARRSSLRSW